MTRSKVSDAQQFKEKIFASPDEVALALEQLRALIKPVDELKREGNPYKDAERSKLEFQIKDALRDIFGEDSPEYQQNKNFRIKSTAKTEVAHALEFLESLIAYLDDKRLELEGRKQQAAAPPSPAPVAPPPPIAQPAAVAPPPRPVAPPPPVAPPRPVMAPPAPPHVAPKVAAPPARSTAPAGSIVASADAVGLLRKIGNRFHAVARQLRLRHESRPTLEVEDEFDAQDVVHALLCLEFDEIRRESWQPGYAGGASHTYFVVPRDRIVIEVKKTRQGLGAKEISGQLDHDSLYYWTHPDCQTLFCFVYDPEARVGDPYGLEKTLTKQVDGQRVEVFISPK
jgi:DpnII restriction endonuclease